MKRPHPPEPVAERAAKPTAECAEEQRDRAAQARIGFVDPEGCHQRRNDEAEHRDVERVEPPAAEACLAGLQPNIVHLSFERWLKSLRNLQRLA